MVRLRLPAVRFEVDLVSLVSLWGGGEEKETVASLEVRSITGWTSKVVGRGFGEVRSMTSETESRGLACPVFAERSEAGGRSPVFGSPNSSNGGKLET